MGGVLCVQVKGCRDEIPCFEIVAEDLSLLKMVFVASGPSLVPTSAFMSSVKIRIPLSEYFPLMTFRWSSASL